MTETAATVGVAARGLLTVREAAGEARVAPVTIYRAIGRGECPAVRVGELRGPLRVPAEEFRAWLLGDAA